jgi:hypothetical protein
MNRLLEAVKVLKVTYVIPPKDIVKEKHDLCLKILNFLTVSVSHHPEQYTLVLSSVFFYGMFYLPPSFTAFGNCSLSAL